MCLIPSRLKCFFLIFSNSLVWYFFLAVVFWFWRVWLLVGSFLLLAFRCYSEDVKLWRLGDVTMSVHQCWQWRGWNRPPVIDLLCFLPTENQTIRCLNFFSLLCASCQTFRRCSKASWDSLRDSESQTDFVLWFRKSKRQKCQWTCCRLLPSSLTESHEGHWFSAYTPCCEAPPPCVTWRISMLQILFCPRDFFISFFFDLVTWINVCWKKIKYSNVHVLIKAIFSTLRCDHVHEPGFCPVLSFSTMFSFVSSNVSCDHDWRWTCNTWSPVTPDLRTSDLRWTWLGWYFLLKWVSTLSPCGQCYIFILNKKQNKNVNFLVGCADIANCICCLCFRLSMFCMVTSSLLMFPFVETPGCLRLASL